MSSWGRVGRRTAVIGLAACLLLLWLPHFHSDGNSQHACPICHAAAQPAQFEPPAALSALTAFPEWAISVTGCPAIRAASWPTCPERAPPA
ncbi:MAG: hypothetical protein ACUVXB_00765 [Bryobacteraceae bacterium]